jgi:hypothetical protein
MWSDNRYSAASSVVFESHGHAHLFQWMFHCLHNLSFRGLPESFHVSHSAHSQRCCTPSDICLLSVLCLSFGQQSFWQGGVVQIVCIAALPRNRTIVVSCRCMEVGSVTSATQLLLQPCIYAIAKT